MGQQRPLAGYSGQVAAYQQRAGDRRVRAGELPGRPEPGNPFLPEPHLVWRGLFHHQSFQGRRPF